MGVWKLLDAARCSAGEHMGLEKSFMVFIITEVSCAHCNIQIFTRWEADLPPAPLHFCRPEVSRADSVRPTATLSVHTQACIHMYTHSSVCASRMFHIQGLLFFHGPVPFWMPGHTEQPPSFSQAHNSTGP